MRALFFRLRFVVAILIAFLSIGRALPGLTAALDGAARHVCTCASGAEHATCPVCNPSLGEHRPSAHASVDGVPCGDRRSAVMVASEEGVLRAALAAIVPAAVRPAVPAAEHVRIDARFIEPATPPPRFART